MIRLFSKSRFKGIANSQLGLYLKYALGEVILVVIGILIALKINNLNELSKYRALEQEYLVEFQEDFEANLESSKATINWIEFIVPRLISLLEQSALDQHSLPLDSLNFYYSLSLEMPTYISTDRVYDNLIGSGEFKLISSTELKNALAEYYKLMELIELVQNTHELELVEAFQPYTLKNLDLQVIQEEMFDDFTMPISQDSTQIISFLHDREFRNIISLKLMILADLLSQNQGILAANQDLLEILKQAQSEAKIPSEKL